MSETLIRSESEKSLIRFFGEKILGPLIIPTESNQRPRINPVLPPALERQFWDDVAGIVPSIRTKSCLSTFGRDNPARYEAYINLPNMDTIAPTGERQRQHIAEIVDQYENRLERWQNCLRKANELVGITPGHHTVFDFTTHRPYEEYDDEKEIKNVGPFAMSWSGGDCACPAKELHAFNEQAARLVLPEGVGIRFLLTRSLVDFEVGSLSYPYVILHAQNLEAMEGFLDGLENDPALLSQVQTLAGEILMTTWVHNIFYNREHPQLDIQLERECPGLKDRYLRSSGALNETERDNIRDYFNAQQKRIRNGNPEFAAWKALLQYDATGIGKLDLGDALENLLARRGGTEPERAARQFMIDWVLDRYPVLRHHERITAAAARAAIRNREAGVSLSPFVDPGMA